MNKQNLTSTASFWDDAFLGGTDYSPLPTSILSDILSNLSPSAPKVCLDIGCGSGQLSRELWHRGFSVTGIDLSEVAINYAKNASVFTGKGLIYIVADTSKTNLQSLPGASFGLITCKLVFAFIKNKPKFLQNVAKSLQKHGVFVLVTPLKKDFPEKPGIGVDFGETSDALAQLFNVHHFEKNKLTYFICHQK